MKHLLRALALLALLPLAAAAESALYGTAFSVLYRIDKHTGAAVQIGPVGYGGISGMVFLNDGRLIASALDSSSSLVLIQIDPATGAGTQIVPGSGFARYPDLAYDRSTGRIFANSRGPNALLELDPVNLAPLSLTGLPTGGGRGLVWDEAERRLIAALGPDLVEVDTPGGVVSTLGSVGPNARISALAFDPSDGELIGSRFSAAGSELVRLVPGAVELSVTAIGPTPWLDAIAFSPPELTGPPLYATTGDHEDKSRLLRIDPDTGFGSLIGDMPGYTGATGLAVLGDGRLVASALRLPSAEASLIEIDRLTGQPSLIGAFNHECERMTDLAYDPLLDVLYGYAHSGGCAQEGLHRIDTATGKATPVGPSGFGGGGNGLAWDPIDGTLYGSPDDLLSLVTFDLATGAASAIPATVGQVERHRALAFHPETGELYGATRGSWDPHLTRIDPATGQVLPIGPTSQSVDALAFDATFSYPPATCAFRGGLLGLNPPDFSCAGSPVVGGTWVAQVQTTPLVGTLTLSTPIVFGLGGPAQGVLVFGWELLVLPPLLEVTGLGTLNISVPPTAPLLGVEVPAQAARLELGASGQVEVVLTNALDLELGF
ncbi:MAG: hypothetical protein AAF682_28480 [Planctomycetota bacterium]